MIERILSLFPPDAHPLTLASDPDSLLAGETVLVSLAGRGFRIIQENDTVVLRFQIEAARPFSLQKPLLVITSGALEELPYDLWQQAHRVKLELHRFFPNLAYPILRTLSPRQLEKLADQQPLLFHSPAGGRTIERLGRLATMDFLLRAVFDLDLESAGQPHILVSWLVHLHDHLAPLPEPLAGRLLEHLRKYPYYQFWDLPELLESREALTVFLQSEWQVFLQATAGKRVSESRLAFHGDEGLQNLLPVLVRKGVLLPETAEQAGDLPDWATVGVVKSDGYRRSELIAELLDELSEKVGGFHIPSRWEDWQAVALLWAGANALLYEPVNAAEKAARIALDEELGQQLEAMAADLDRLFSAWLEGHYAPLGAQRLPVPKHVFHIPHYLAHLRERGTIQRIALIVLDGLSLLDWQVIRSSWATYHPGWQLTEMLLLAQIPTITSISRRSLVSGLRPADFAVTGKDFPDLDHLPSEKELWIGFWSRAGLPEEAVYYSTISLDRQEYPPEVDRSRLAALCLVDDTPDRIAHNAVLGTASQQTDLRLWLERGRAGNTEPLEQLLDRLIHRGFNVYIASDHGHVEARGVGAPAEGILAQTRGKRARLYRDRLIAQRTQDLFSETILWTEDGLLPEGLCALLPSDRSAFTTDGETVVTHGGLSLDEVIVPFIQIAKGL